MPINNVLAQINSGSGRSIQDCEEVLSTEMASAIKDIARQNLEEKKGIYYPEKAFEILNKSDSKEAKKFRSSDVFTDFYLNPDYYSRGLNSREFVIKEFYTGFTPIQPNEAIEKIASNRFAVMDCGFACQLAEYKAAVKLFGEKKFNQLFAPGTDTALKFGYDITNHPIFPLRKHIHKENPEMSEIKKGDILYCTNVEKYLKKHPLGNCPGFNLVCKSNKNNQPKFLGMGLPCKGVIKEELDREMREDYNFSSREPHHLSEDLKKKFYQPDPSLKNDKISKEEYPLQGGGKLTLVARFDFQKMTELANAPIEQAKELLKKW